jgi:hypothetical protein
MKGGIIFALIAYAVLFCIYVNAEGCNPSILTVYNVREKNPNSINELLENSSIRMNLKGNFLAFSELLPNRTEFYRSVNYSKIVEEKLIELDNDSLVNLKEGEIKKIGRLSKYGVKIERAALIKIFFIKLMYHWTYKKDCDYYLNFFGLGLIKYNCLKEVKC